MIDGVFIEELEIISVEKGDVFHMINKDSPLFNEFGEIYFSFIKPNVIKGWKKHKIQNQTFSVPIGNIKLVMFDDREISKTSGEIQEEIIGIDSYRLIRVPNNIWYSFSALGNEKAMIVNLTDLPHDPAEAICRDIDDASIPYIWNK